MLPRNLILFGKIKLGLVIGNALVLVSAHLVARSRLIDLTTPGTNHLEQIRRFQDRTEDLRAEFECLTQTFISRQFDHVRRIGPCTTIYFAPTCPSFRYRLTASSTQIIS